MNHKTLVKITNFIAIIGSLGLVYWVFGFILIQVFGLKVFQRNITEMFGLSVLGILAILAGALILNIMLNLTRIANQKENPNIVENTAKKSHIAKIFSLAILMFFVIAGGLFWGDNHTRQKKFSLMQASAQQVIDKYMQSLAFLAEYQFNKAWIDKADKQIELLRATNTHINQVIIIMPDKVNDENVYLAFGQDKTPRSGIPDADDIAKNHVTTFEVTSTTASENTQNTTPYFYKKTDFIFKADTKQNHILNEMFAGKNTPSHSSYDGKYEMFYPYQVDGKTVAVLYMTDYMAYGKVSAY